VILHGLKIPQEAVSLRNGYAGRDHASRTMALGASTRLVGRSVAIAIFRTMSA